MKIFLDDIRFPIDSGWSIVRTYDDFIYTWAKNREDVTDISFDHDLGGGRETGFDALNFIEADIKLGVKVHPELKMTVHSVNFEEARKMRDVINRLGRG